MGFKGVAKVQHYVPQFLLRNFGNGKKDQLNVFDKHKDRSFLTNAKNVACESRFYDFNLDEVELTLEPTLSVLEGDAKKLLQRILDNDEINVFSSEERVLLSKFFAVQFTRTRTRAFKEQCRHLPELLGNRMKEMFSNSDDYPAIAEYIELPDENELKVQMAHFIITAPENFGAHFESKTWLLLATSPKMPFLIGDHPLAMQNTIDTAPYGNIGIGVTGIEIYFPLSPTRAIAMWCSSHKQRIQQVIQKSTVIKPQGIKDMWAAMTTGKPLHYSNDNVVNFNALQVLHAERYVFSCNDDFSLPRLMVSENPSLRVGRRTKLS